MKTLRELAEEQYSCIEAQFMDVQLWDEYCKATNPTAILALLDQIDDLKHRLTVESTLNDTAISINIQLTAERDALAEKLNSFEKSIEERKAFEEAVRRFIDPQKADAYLLTDKRGNYEQWGLMLAWEAWQAAKADRGQS